MTETPNSLTNTFMTPPLKVICRHAVGHQPNAKRIQGIRVFPITYLRYLREQSILSRIRGVMRSLPDSKAIANLAMRLVIDAREKERNLHF